MLPTIRDALVNLLARMVRQAGIVSDETKTLEHLCDKHGGRLLPIHTDSKGLRSSQ